LFSTVPKVGIEPSSACIDQQQTAANLTIEPSINPPDSASKCAILPVVDDSLDDSSEGQGSHGRLPAEALIGVVETALSRALTLAAEAGRWEIVVQLAEELAARQRARDGLSGIVRRDGAGKRELR
jgi:hypothetical protein